MNYAYQEGFDAGYQKGYEDGMMAYQRQTILDMINAAYDKPSFLKDEIILDELEEKRTIS